MLNGVTNAKWVCVSPHRISDRLLNKVDGATSVKKKEHAFCFDLHKHAVNWRELFSRILKRDQTETRLCVIAKQDNSMIDLSTDNWSRLARWILIFCEASAL